MWEGGAAGKLLDVVIIEVVAIACWWAGDKRCGLRKLGGQLWPQRQGARGVRKVVVMTVDAADIFRGTCKGTKKMHKVSVVCARILRKPLPNTTPTRNRNFTKLPLNC